MTIRKWIPAIAAAVTAFATVAHGQPVAPTTKPSPEPPAEAQLAVFLLVGQSNMAGRGKVEEQDRVADPRLWTLDKNDAWVPAVDPLHFDKPKVVGVGLGRSFAIALLAREPDAIVGLVPCAVGGTSINQWSRGGKLYDDAIRRARIASTRGDLRGILWHQGESDSAEEKMAVYPEKLAKVLAAFREDLKVPAVPIVIGQLGPFYEKRAPTLPAFNAMLVRFAASQSNVACVTSEGLTDGGDDTHFDAASQRELGRRYAAAYFKLVEAATTRPAVSR